MRTLVLFTRTVLLSPFAAAARSHQVMSRHWKEIVSSFIYYFWLNLFGHLLQFLALFGLKWVNNTRIFCIFHLKKLMEELCCAAEEFEEKKKFRSKIYTKLQRILFISNLPQKLSKYWNFNSLKDQFSK